MTYQNVVELILIDGESLIFKRFVVEASGNVRELESLRRWWFQDFEHGLQKVAVPRGTQVDGSKSTFSLEQRNAEGEVLQVIYRQKI